MLIDIQLPDLTGLSNNSASYAMHRFFSGAGPTKYDEYALIVNFIRLVDLAITEYQKARELVFVFWNTHDGVSIGAINLASGHLEACISDTKRSLNYLKSIRAYQSFSKDIKDLLPHSLQVLRSETEKRISRLRHAVQHLETQIKAGCVIEGQSVFLQPGQVSLELGGESILYTELASWLSELHGCTSRLFEYFALKKVDKSSI